MFLVNIALPNKPNGNAEDRLLLWMGPGRIRESRRRWADNRLAGNEIVVGEANAKDLSRQFNEFTDLFSGTNRWAGDCERRRKENPDTPKPTPGPECLEPVRGFVRSSGGFTTLCETPQAARRRPVIPAVSVPKLLPPFRGVQRNGNRIAEFGVIFRDGKVQFTSRPPATRRPVTPARLTAANRTRATVVAALKLTHRQLRQAVIDLAKVTGWRWYLAFRSKFSTLASRT